MFNDWKRFVELTEIAVRIRDCEADWPTKYNAIFSSEISRQINALAVPFSYVDPDTSEEEDVRAYVCALEEHAERLRPLLNALPQENKL